MHKHRMAHAVDAIAEQPAGSLAHRLCAAAEDQLDASGSASEGEALQTDLGEGPSYAANRIGWPVLVPDIDRADRWPAFGPAASALGLCAIFAFPLRQGALRLGLTALRARAFSDGQSIRDLATEVVNRRLRLDED